MINVNKYFENYDISYINYSLKRIKLLVLESKLDIKKIKYIHITGSKGKGSTAFYLNEFFQKSNLKTGLFTSPHIIKINERIKINGKNILNWQIADILEKNKILINKIKPTYFELIFFVALVHFCNEKIDWAVIEVGLGGRFDATNIIKPVISIITNIELEHRDYLGNTKREILIEKSKIIKKGCICITGIKDKNLLLYLNDYCKKLGVILKIINKKFIFNFEKNKFNYRDEYIQFDDISIKNNSISQSSNLALALNTVTNLYKKFNIDFDLNKIKKVIFCSLPYGRFTVLKDVIKNIPLIFDAAHTPESIKSLNDNLLANNCIKNVFIFNCLKDKNYKEMLKLILKTAAKIFILKINSKREVDYNKLESYLNNAAVEFCFIEEVQTLNFEKLQKYDSIVVTGSFYVISKVIKNLRFKKLGSLKIG